MLKRFFVLTLCILITFSAVITYAQTNISTIEAPKKLTVELKNHDDGIPYFELNIEDPLSVEELAQNTLEDEGIMFYDVQYKVGNGDWEQSGEVLFTEGSTIWMDPEDMGIGQNVDIKANKYYFKARYEYFTYEVVDDDGNRVNTGSFQSPFSDIASIGIDEYKIEYKDASEWAKSELDKAAEYGFITDKIKDKMNGPITREEFCEIAVKLYEKLTGQSATYDNMNAFTDTKNPEIFKAYELGFVEGVGENKFAPNNLTNREQVATLMHRAIKVINPLTDFSTDGVGSFNDQHLISGWALESVKFMNKNGIMQGDAGMINPKGTTTREQAVILILRTYEKYSQEN